MAFDNNRANFRSRHSSNQYTHISPTFDRTFSTSLGSPFLTTVDDLDLVDGSLSAVPRRCTITRPPSTDFSIINVPNHDEQEDYYYSSMSLFGTPIGLRRPVYSASYNLFNPSPERNVLRSLFPRLWDALSSPVKNARPRSGSGSPTDHGSPSRKGKSKEHDYPYRYDCDSESSVINYLDLDPLDGEEGELIDDEACFIDVMAITGIDIISLLPTEISLHILSTFLDLPSVIACLAVSKKWRRLASDNAVWHALFLQNSSIGWGVDLQRWRGPRDGGRRLLRERNVTACIGTVLEEWNQRGFNSGSGLMEDGPPPFRRIYATSPRLGRRSSMMSSCVVQRSHSFSAVDSLRIPIPLAPLTLDWRSLYEDRLELDKRWGVPGQVERGKQLWEPAIVRVSGHSDSVYCLEFDSTKIITGSRDRSIKVWSLKTGELLGTFRGHHGSVLCLKFDKDWDSEHRDAYHFSSGMMVSGSSDCNVCVWELRRGRRGGLVTGEVNTVLKGHKGGVLDIRIDAKWIVSCSKDTSIRIWDRHTLKHFRTLKGHEGPVNAVGLQPGRVVSASGDGKMILWDIESGASLRTFEGHDRGLACIDFKDDLIVSGSNDCKIKVWSASTGECIKTLSGHEALVRALSFDPLSRRLVSASYDKTIKVWDLNSGKMVREFRSVHSSHIFDVQFDAAKIVSTSHDQKIIVLDFALGIDTSLFV